MVTDQQYWRLMKLQRTERHGCRRGQGWDEREDGAQVSAVGQTAGGCKNAGALA